ncbi:hypothetical protein [Saccharothrix australiensis]|uniref:Uncharacterized protein n=1 Tax=Saccharothrix australiensis TaxID=2072 RepID=A0A495VYY2_9PSEU|nr:hypothetical protein [Saccharothrix australiensis]RKT52798.1 hypothetical protein C8E97_1334 [Saccharothrix australiensis]
MNDRGLAVSCALVFAILLGVVALGFAQIASTYQWCEGDAAGQLASIRAVAELRLDATPAVVCRSGEVTVELPIAPAVAVVAFAVVGMAISLVTVVVTARRVRAAKRR